MIRVSEQQPSLGLAAIHMNKVHQLPVKIQFGCLGIFFCFSLFTTVFWISEVAG